MAGNRFSRFYGVLLFSGILLTACPAFCGNSQMLPPTPFSSLTPCAASATGLTASILAYSGSTTAEAGINCINGLTGNSNGDLTIGSGNLYSNVGSTFGGTTTFAAGGTTTFNNSPSFSYGATFGGATLFNGSSTFNNGLTVNNAGAVFNKGISVNNNGVTVDGAGPVMSADVTTLNALRNISGCATNQALTKTSVGFACVAVTDIVGVGTTTVPSCPSGQQLYFNGSGFTCNNIPFPAPAPTPPVCTGANVLQFDGTSYNCVPVPSAGNAGSGINSIYGSCDMSWGPGWYQSNSKANIMTGGLSCPGGTADVIEYSFYDSASRNCDMHVCYNVPSGSCWNGSSFVANGTTWGVDTGTKAAAPSQPVQCWDGSTGQEAYYYEVYAIFQCTAGGSGDSGQRQNGPATDAGTNNCPVCDCTCSNTCGGGGGG